MVHKFIGNRQFYRRVLAIMVPILIQNVITNFVNLLDNIMVGQVGTEPMSSVAIINQLVFIFNLTIFGGLAGPGIFSAQFYGKGDNDGVRNTFRMKMYIALAAAAVLAAVYAAFGTPLIRLFLHEGTEDLDIPLTLQHAQSYLKIILITFLPFAVSQCYSGTLRETGETVVPMQAGIAAVFINLIFNYIFIFGKFGCPAMGVEGAAIATVMARFAECAIVMIWTHRHSAQKPFITGLYRSLKVPAGLVKDIAIKGAPLLANEILWSSGMTILNQCYSLRGLEVVSATNISSTISNLFFCAYFSMGNTISIMVGQLLGAGETERAVDEDRKLITMSVLLCVVMGSVMAVLSPLIPEIYNTTAYVKKLACELLLVSSAMMPFFAFVNACYFTLRSGGKTVITFIFDSGFEWVVLVPAAFVLSHFTQMPILPLYAIVQALEIIKCVVGFIFVKQRKWVNNLVSA